MWLPVIVTEATMNALILHQRVDTRCKEEFQSIVS